MKKITSKDVAKLAGVSQSMVSLVLNDVKGKKIKNDTRERIIKAAKELNYRLDSNARNLKTNKANAIGVFSFWDEGTFVFPPAIEGISDFCEKMDQALILCTGKKDKLGQYDFIKYYLEGRIDGVIYIGCVEFEENEVVSNLKKFKIPFVQMIGGRNFDSITQIDIDFYKNGEIAAKHAYKCGYRKIYYQKKDDVLIYAEKERLEGVLNTCNELGIDFEFISTYNSKEMANMNACYIDTSNGCRLVLENALKNNIKVNEQLGVISLDNEIFAPYLYPPLTCVDEPLTKMANASAYILFDLINDKKVKRVNTFLPVLNKRKTT